MRTSESFSKKETKYGCRRSWAPSSIRSCSKSADSVEVFAIHFANVSDFPNFPVFIMLHLRTFQQIVLFCYTFFFFFKNASLLALGTRHI